ncbi:MAG TPA: caspase family protein [Bacillota bacterium]|nr:caspase family protein [Bacillota bacterium]
MLYAILVGLKEFAPQIYGSYGDWGCWGSEKDVNQIAKLLKPLKYKISKFKTKKATRDVILNALKEKAEQCIEGDTLVFYFSGHGGQQPVTDSINIHEQSDKRNETLCAYDGEIIDDELNKIWLNFRPGVRLVMFSDSCNAGTNFRGFQASLKWFRSLVKPAHSKTKSEIKTNPKKSVTLWKPFIKIPQPEMKAQLIHMGGCPDGGESQGTQAGGDFTLALVEVWNKGKFEGGYPEFHEAISKEVESIQRQRPQPFIQKPQYSEYGPVTQEFRNQKPFSPSKTPDSPVRKRESLFNYFIRHRVAR